jgi:hypothetical protein
MKTKRIFNTLFALVVVSAMLACSFSTKVSTDQPDVSLEEPDVSLEEPDVSSEEPDVFSEQPYTGEEENSEPIVGTWKQIHFQGVGGNSNYFIGGSGIWFGDYYYVGTRNMGSAVIQPQEGVVTGSGVGPESGGPDPVGSASIQNGAEIWRTRDGITWEVVGEPGLGNPEIFAFRTSLFQDSIFVITEPKPSLLVSKDGETFEPVKGDWSNGETESIYDYYFRELMFLYGFGPQKGIQAWLSTDGERFDKVIEDGFGNPANEGMCGYSTSPSLNGWYYLGVRNDVNGGELWRTKDGRSWEKSLTGGFDDPSKIMLCVSLIHDGYMYIVIPAYYGHGPSYGVDVIRTADGKNWAKVIENGFGLGEEQGYSGAFSIYKDAIYFMLWNFPQQSGGPPSTGFRLLKSLDGKTWQQVGEPGFGYPNNFSAAPYVIRGVFYLGTINQYDGNQIWRSNDGTNWELFFTAPASQTSNGLYLVEIADGLEYFELDISRGIQIWRYGP